MSATSTAGEATHATAKAEADASKKGSVTPVFATIEAAKAALLKAPDLIVGSNAKDTVGCLYTVASRDSNLVLVPVIVNGKRVCAASK